MCRNRLTRFLHEHFVHVTEATLYLHDLLDRFWDYLKATAHSRHLLISTSKPVNTSHGTQPRKIKLRRAPRATKPANSSLLVSRVKIADSWFFDKNRLTALRDEEAFCTQIDRDLAWQVLCFFFPMPSSKHKMCCALSRNAKLFLFFFSVSCFCVSLRTSWRSLEQNFHYSPTNNLLMPKLKLRRWAFDSKRGTKYISILLWKSFRKLFAIARHDRGRKLFPKNLIWALSD